MKQIDSTPSVLAMISHDIDTQFKIVWRDSTTAKIDQHCVTIRNPINHTLTKVELLVELQTALNLVEQMEE